MDNKWNRALRDACVKAFVSAVDRFNAGALKYSWARYLPNGDISSFFKPMRDGILRVLKDRPILQSHDTMVKPSLLTYVPPHRFSDVKDTPFTLSALTRATYLSSAYRDREARALASLGVKVMDERRFLGDLAGLLASAAAEFRKRPREWHAQLAKVLVTLATDDFCKSLIRNMEIIQLRDRRWVAARDESIFFNNSAKAPNIPEAVNVNVVHADVEADVHCRDLLALLGVKPFEVADICHAIIDMHHDDGFEPKSLTTAELVSHTTFMYKASFQPPNGVDLWLATARGGHERSSQVYMETETNLDTAEARIIQQLKEEFPFIHPSYYSAFSDDKSWIIWLQKSIGLSTLPKIHVGEASDGSLRLSDEFHFLLKGDVSVDMLLLLRNNWQEYSKWVEGPGAKNGGTTAKASLNNIRDALGGANVPCKTVIDQSRPTRFIPLRKTILPGLDSVVDSNAHILKLDIPDHGNPRWSMLSNLGVSVKRDYHYYIHCLQSMNTSNPKKQDVAHIYQNIQANYVNNPKLIL